MLGLPWADWSLGCPNWCDSVCDFPLYETFSFVGVDVSTTVLHEEMSHEHGTGLPESSLRDARLGFLIIIHTAFNRRSGSFLWGLVLAPSVLYFSGL